MKIISKKKLQRHTFEKTVFARISEENHQKLHTMAKSTGISTSNLIRIILAEFLEENKKIKFIIN